MQTAGMFRTVKFSSSSESFPFHAFRVPSHPSPTSDSNSPSPSSLSAARKTNQHQHVAFDLRATDISHIRDSDFAMERLEEEPADVHGPDDPSSPINIKAAGGMEDASQYIRRGTSTTAKTGSPSSHLLSSSRSRRSTKKRSTTRKNSARATTTDDLDRALGYVLGQLQAPPALNQQEQVGPRVSFYAATGVDFLTVSGSVARKTLRVMCNHLRKLQRTVHIMRNSSVAARPSAPPAARPSAAMGVPSPRQTTGSSTSAAGRASVARFPSSDVDQQQRERGRKADDSVASASPGAARKTDDSLQSGGSATSGRKTSDDSAVVVQLQASTADDSTSPEILKGLENNIRSWPAVLEKQRSSSFKTELESSHEAPERSSFKTDLEAEDASQVLEPDEEKLVNETQDLLEESAKLRENILALTKQLSQMRNSITSCTGRNTAAGSTTARKSNAPLGTTILTSGMVQLDNQFLQQYQRPSAASDLSPRMKEGLHKTLMKLRVQANRVAGKVLSSQNAGYERLRVLRNKGIAVGEGESQSPGGVDLSVVEGGDLSVEPRSTVFWRATEHNASTAEDDQDLERVAVVAGQVPPPEQADAMESWRASQVSLQMENEGNAEDRDEFVTPTRELERLHDLVSTGSMLRIVRFRFLRAVPAVMVKV
ncbi:unnamed protein product [Amoebophrya sp. A25]|nr:unnamed protein product [Amoebophrya sp. A25]|eukprot:GSA25T00014834001.1